MYNSAGKNFHRKLMIVFMFFCYSPSVKPGIFSIFTSAINNVVDITFREVIRTSIAWYMAHKVFGYQDGFYDQAREVVRQIDALKMKLNDCKAPDGVKSQLGSKLQAATLGICKEECLDISHEVLRFCQIPWGVKKPIKIDIVTAAKLLDSTHFGLESVKERVLDYLSIVDNFRDGHPPILCLLGPPGVGKTSIAQSIAQCLGVGFGMVKVSGMTDADVFFRGFHSAYMASNPGFFVNTFSQVGHINPVILLDEIDKVTSHSHHGSAAGILLDILDPCCQALFKDNWLGVPFDISHAFFITTANDYKNIPISLYDRMEFIHIAGYTPDEKKILIKKYLVPKMCQNLRIDPEALILSDDIIDVIVDLDKGNCGVRDLNRMVSRLGEKYVRASKAGAPLAITPELIHSIS